MGAIQTCTNKIADASLSSTFLGENLALEVGSVVTVAVPASHLGLIH